VPFGTHNTGKRRGAQSGWTKNKQNTPLSPVASSTSTADVPDAPGLGRSSAAPRADRPPCSFPWLRFISRKDRREMYVAAGAGRREATAGVFVLRVERFQLGPVRPSSVQVRADVSFVTRDRTSTKQCASKSGKIHRSEPKETRDRGAHNPHLPSQFGIWFCQPFPQPNALVVHRGDPLDISNANRREEEEVSKAVFLLVEERLPTLQYHIRTRGTAVSYVLRRFAFLVLHNKSTRRFETVQRLLLDR
jgi:hypothetical protein